MPKQSGKNTYNFDQSLEVHKSLTFAAFTLISLLWERLPIGDLGSLDQFLVATHDLNDVWISDVWIIYHDKPSGLHRNSKIVNGWKPSDDISRAEFGVVFDLHLTGLGCRKLGS